MAIWESLVPEAARFCENCAPFVAVSGRAGDVLGLSERHRGQLLTNFLL